MAMLITKFHRMIQNKVVWIGFTVIVVLSFAFLWGTNTGGSGGGGQGSSDAGELDGEKIPYSAYRQARFNTYLGLVLMTGRPINITPEMEDELHDMAWARIASLREAEKLGITANNEEVVRSIQSFEFLKPGGRYNPQAYQQFEQQFLAPMRATKRDFEEHVRQEIIIQKLRMVLNRLQLISPQEVTRTYHTISDVFNLEYVRLTPDMVEDDVTVTDEDARAFFEEDPERFRLAEKVKVKAAVFPVADYVEDVEISDEEIQEYYDFNIDQYAIQPDDEESTNLFSTSFTTYTPIEEVRDDISDRLARMQAAILAENTANDFIQELSNRRAEGLEAFDDVAVEFGTEMIMVTPFTARQVPDELDAGPAAARAAFNLTNDPDYYYSDPVAGSNAVYVLSLVERQPSRIPAFEEVEEDVRLLAREFAVQNALTERAQGILEQSRETVAEGGAFDDVLSDYDLSADEIEAFSLNTSAPEEGFPEEIVRDILVCNEGEFTELIPGQAGDVLIAYVKSRKPSMDANPDAMRSQLVQTLRQQSSQVAFDDFQQFILSSSGFVDYLRRDQPEALPEEDAAAEAGTDTDPS